MMLVYSDAELYRCIRATADNSQIPGKRHGGWSESLYRKIGGTIPVYHIQGELADELNDPQNTKRIISN